MDESLLKRHIFTCPSCRSQITVRPLCIYPDGNSVQRSYEGNCWKCNYYMYMYDRDYKPEAYYPGMAYLFEDE
jgi:hypothetical protein